MKLQIFCSSDEPISFKFHHLIVKSIIKELQIVSETFNVSNRNGNTEEFERKFSVKSSCSDRVFYVTGANTHIGSLKYHL